MVRRRAFEEKAASLGKKAVIALAHHENDNAETVLHNLIRGTKAAGWEEYDRFRKLEKELHISVPY